MQPFPLGPGFRLQRRVGGCRLCAHEGLRLQPVFYQSLAESLGKRLPSPNLRKFGKDWFYFLNVWQSSLVKPSEPSRCFCSKFLIRSSVSRYGSLQITEFLSQRHFLFLFTISDCGGPQVPEAAASKTMDKGRLLGDGAMQPLRLFFVTLQTLSPLPSSAPVHIIIRVYSLIKAGRCSASA